MKPLLPISFICIFFTLTIFAQPKTKYSEVRITIAKEQIIRLQENALDFDHGQYDEINKTFTIVIPAQNVAILKNLGYKYKLLVPDTKADFLKRSKKINFYEFDNMPVQMDAGISNRFAYSVPNGQVASIITTPAAFTAGSMAGYYTLTELNAKLNAMVTAYPTLVSIQSIGTTGGGRPIRVVKISSNVSVESGKPEVLYTSLTHAREPMGMMNVIFFMQYILENYNTNNPLIYDLINNRSLYFIPCMNPDGYQYNCQADPGGGGMHRKNRTTTGNMTSTSNIGTDLNRNWSFGFGYANGGSSNTLTADDYRGPSAFSEFETQAVRTFINAREIKFALNYHASGEYWIHPFCVPDGGVLTTLDSRILETSSAIMTRTNFFKVGTPINSIGYNANGSTDDWFMGGEPANHNKIYSITPEVYPGNGNFWPNSNQAIPTAKSLVFGNLQAALFAGAYGKIEDISSQSLSGTSGNMDFTLRRFGLTNAPITVTLVPLQNMQTAGSPVVVGTASIPNPLDTYNGSISYTLPSGLIAGQKIRFAWKAEMGGITLIDTLTKIYSPASTTVFTDNMEGTLTTKWTATGTWAFSSTLAQAGTKSLATTASADYGNNATMSARITGVLNLSGANTAYLTFWSRFRSQTGFDKLRIQAASNGNVGAPTWVSLPSSYTIAENKGTIGGTPALTGIRDYWVKEIVDLSAYTGGTNVGIRFLFESDAATTEDGFFIDNVEVVKSVSTLTLPVSFISIKADAGDENISVIWKAQTTNEHDHFEVERSSDGMNFFLIGKVNHSGFDFSFIDNNPLPGTNYYRVKGVDIDGKFNYTPVVSANSDRPTTFRLYPNPVKQQLNLQIRTDISVKYDFEIISSVGQAVRKISKEILPGAQVISIPVHELPAGSYLLRIRNKSEIIASQPFVKSGY